MTSQLTDSLAEQPHVLLFLLVAWRAAAAVVGVETVGEVLGVVEAGLAGVVLPARVVALVGQVALVHPALQAAQVQPHLVVLEDPKIQRFLL